jgi:site-specific recombinase XerD
MRNNTTETSLEKGLTLFVDSLSGKNRSRATIRAYSADVRQFISYLHDTSVTPTHLAAVTKVDVVEYFSFLSRKALTGVARARKLSAIREYFRFLEGVGMIPKSPTTGIDTPKREKHTRQYLRSDEYTKMLSLAGGSPRDYAILQMFLQTGIRVSELVRLTVDDVDFNVSSTKEALEDQSGQSCYLLVGEVQRRFFLLVGIGTQGGQHLDDPVG